MTAPSQFFRQHHVVDEPLIDGRSFRPFWRVRKTPMLDQLFRDQAISFAMWRAGARFRMLAELVIAQQWSTKWLSSNEHAQTFDGATTRRLDAIKEMRLLRRAIGRFDLSLLEAHIVDDLSWTELGKRLDVHPKTAKRWTLTALRGLASVIW